MSTVTLKATYQWSLYVYSNIEGYLSMVSVVYVYNNIKGYLYATMMNKPAITTSWT